MMRASVAALFLLAGCSPSECEPSAQAVHGEFSLAARPSAERVWIDVPCTVIAVTSFAISLSCPELAAEVSTATIAFSINPIPPLVEAPPASEDPIALTYVERVQAFTPGKFLRMERDGDLRVLALQSVGLDGKQVLGSADYTPFTIGESELACGREGGRIGHGVEFTSASGTVTVFDQQSMDTSEWSIRVPSAATFEPEPNCADCGIPLYEFFVAAH